MNTDLLTKIGEGLKVQLSEKMGLDPALLQRLVNVGQNSLSESIKQFVMKNGSKEIEDILLQRQNFEGSALQRQVKTQLKNDVVAQQLLPAEQADELSAHASTYLVQEITQAFQGSSYSKDLDGICGFLGIDKNLLKMINSPMGKMFGKFF